MSSIKVALIPPRGLENHALRSRTHMALAIPGHLKSPVFMQMFSRASRLGDFVILDNGACEGELCPSDELLAASKLIGAKELIVPDVLRDCNATIAAVRAFMDIRVSGPFLVPSKLMAIAQGTKVHQFKACVNEYASMPSITTLGIPRLMTEVTGNPAARIDLATWVRDFFTDKGACRFEIHFMGMDSAWPGEVKAAAKYVPFVRSVDSSLPFKYAIADMVLSDSGTKQRPVLRPPSYFKVDWSKRVVASLVQRNIDTLMEWAGANERRTSTTTRQPSSAEASSTS